MMKKMVSFLLTLAVCAALLVPASAAGTIISDGVPLFAEATNDTIVVSNSADVPDAHLVHPAVYKIRGNNYFKLRDVAMMLNGSERQFSVDYDDAAKTVSITSGKPYEALGTELTGAASETASARPTNNAITIDGETVTLTVFKIGGANYFRLRDLGKALDFHVGYDDETKTVFLSGAKGYEEETVSEKGLFEAQYIRTDGYHDGVSYPRVTLIGSAEELNRYYDGNKALYDFRHKEKVYSDTTVGFVDAIAKYDGAWFRDHELILVLLEEGSGSVRHEVTEVNAGEEPFVKIARLVPEVGTDDMAEWHILIETERVFGAASEIRAVMENRGAQG